MENRFCEMKLNRILEKAFLSKQAVLEALDECYRHGHAMGYKSGHTDGYARGVNEAITIPKVKVTL